MASSNLLLAALLVLACGITCSHAQIYAECDAANQVWLVRGAREPSAIAEQFVPQALPVPDIVAATVLLMRHFIWVAAIASRPGRRS